MPEIILVWKILIWIFYLVLMLWASYYLFGSFIALYRTSWVPYIPSYNEDLEFMREKLDLEPHKTLIDLGCWDGKAMRFFIKNFKVKKAVWYDLNWPAILIGRIINKLYKIDNIQLIKDNFLKADVSNYDYVYVYLLSEYMAQIEDWLFNNISENTIIISNTFKFSKNEPYKIEKNSKWKDRIMYYRKTI